MIKPLVSQNPKIEIVEIVGHLTGNSAIEFRKFLYDCLDRGIYRLMIDAKSMSVIDKEMIDLIGDFKIKDMQIQLFNVGAELRWLIKRSGRLDVLKKIQDNIDISEAISLFDKNVSYKKGKDLNKRRCSRTFNIVTPAEFYYNPLENRMISGVLHILNISEKGALAGRILVVNKLTGRTFSPPQINKQKLYKLRFKLDEDGNDIETTARCVREYSIGGSLYAGIEFLDINEEDKLKINEFVSSFYDLGRLT
ncbi:MAG: PilZ domain-containing protein [Candidatus Anammoxibacter sp.]